MTLIRVQTKSVIGKLFAGHHISRDGFASLAMTAFFLSVLNGRLFLFGFLLIKLPELLAEYFPHGAFR